MIIIVALLHLDEATTVAELGNLPEEVAFKSALDELRSRLSERAQVLTKEDGALYDDSRRM